MTVTYNDDDPIDWDDEAIHHDTDPIALSAADALLDAISDEVANRLALTPLARDDEETRSTWWPIELALIAPGGRTEPTLATRTDGANLLYPAKIHAFNGESESGKTWAALHTAAQIVGAGGHVLYVDFEDGPETLLERLHALGVAHDAACRHVHYVRPQEPLSDQRGRITRGEIDLVEAMGQWDCDLAILDGVTEAMNLEGLNPLDNNDTAQWFKVLPRRIADRGPAVVLIDHVTKAKEERGRFAIGAQHKLAALDGAAYTFEVAKPFGRGRDGLVKITVAKDRPGAIRAIATGKRIADMVVTATADGLTIELRPPETATESDGTFRPTHLMEKVSRWLELNPGASTRATREAVRGRAEVVVAALDQLVAEGFVERSQDTRGTRHTVVNKFREDPS